MTAFPDLRLKRARLDTYGRPDVPELVDRYGRVARDLRISVTDRCNLRCQYCMPEEGQEFLPTPEVLTDDEIIRLMRIAVDELRIEEIRFTGGEPLMRKSLEKLVAAARGMTAWTGVPLDLSLTTNGLGFKHRARGLAEAGLNRVNVSMDTVSPQAYATLTRRNRLKDAQAGAAAAAEAGMTPVKLNALVMPGVNEDGVCDLLQYALEHHYELRFIEFMPLGPRGTWKRSQMVTREDILRIVEQRFELTHRPGPERGASPAEEWDVLSGTNHPGGRFGIVASVSRPFCGECDRTRLTADGQLRSCLFAREETDLRALLRGGASDTEIADTWRAAMWGKQAGHRIDDPGFLSPARPMSAIGG